MAFALSSVMNDRKFFCCETAHQIQSRKILQEWVALIIKSTCSTLEKSPLNEVSSWTNSYRVSQAICEGNIDEMLDLAFLNKRSRLLISPCFHHISLVFCWSSAWQIWRDQTQNYGLQLKCVNMFTVCYISRASNVRYHYISVFKIKMLPSRNALQEAIYHIVYKKLQLVLGVCAAAESKQILGLQWQRYE